MTITNPFRRLLIIAAASISTLPATALAQSGPLYPTCNNPQVGICAMNNNATGFTNSTGNVQIYVLFYGSRFQSGTLDPYLGTAVQNFLSAINDSNYEAPLGTYTALSTISQTNVVDQNYSQTRNITSFGQIAAAIEAQLAPSGPWPIDPNAVYLFIPDTSVTISTNLTALNGTTVVSPFCTQSVRSNCFTGWNSNVQVSGGQTIKWGMVLNGLVTPTVQWGFHTPNDANGFDGIGEIDKTVSNVAHEINEAITQHWTTGTSTNNQMGDLCQNQTQNQYTTISLSGAQAQANFHGDTGDFMVQPERLNAFGNGYCVNSYGGSFWGQNFGYQHNPLTFDWAPGNFKGVCESQQPMIGLSESPGTNSSGIQFSHTVFCDPGTGSAGNSSFFSDFNTTGGQCNAIGIEQRDSWDPGLDLGECGQSQFVAGVDQLSDGELAGMLCCSSPTGTVRHQNCQPKVFDSNNVSPYDWDYGWNKAQCSPGQYMAGVSRGGAPTFGPHAILCCSP
jgi:hypothetical protein